MNENEKREQLKVLYSGTLKEISIKIEEKVEETIAGEDNIFLAFNRLFIHFRGYDKVDNAFSFSIGEVEYMLFHDPFREKIYLGAMIGLAKKTA